MSKHTHKIKDIQMTTPLTFINVIKNHIKKKKISRIATIYDIIYSRFGSSRFDHSKVLQTHVTDYSYDTPSNEL